MKKLVIALCIALAGIAAHAQESGSMGLGVNLGVAPILEDGAPTNFEIGAKFQYGLTGTVRLQADLDYAFKADYVDVLTVSANAHFLIPVADKVRLYPLAGLGYGRVGYSAGFNFGGGHFKVSDHFSRFLFNVGLGGEYDFATNLAVNLEFKYQYMKDFNRLPILLGLTYRF
ncbi:MAG: porin family protein [Muribaculaceae bacterium]|nr:porin family protein [Muribaculaceae bacterium]MDE6487286.1 porin family protein [Muribaculaceae bacterium]